MGFGRRLMIEYRRRTKRIDLADYSVTTKGN